MNHEAELEQPQEPQPVIPIEDIKPTMTIVDRERALKEIMRVLRGEE